MDPQVRGDPYQAQNWEGNASARTSTMSVRTAIFYLVAMGVCIHGYSGE
jgi:hypothetical protein